MSRLATPRTATVLGALTVLLLVLWGVLTVLTRDLRATTDGVGLVPILSFAVVGFVIARRQPRNAVGWLLLGVGLIVILDGDSRLYAVLDYRLHDGNLPLGHAMIFWIQSYTLLPLLLGIPVILLFPDGRLESARWRRVLRIYTALAALFMVAVIAAETTVPLGRHVPIDVWGKYSSGDPTGIGVVFAVVGWLATPFFLIFWGSFIAHQVSEWRRSGGERREQVKWLMSGGAIAVFASVSVVVSDPGIGVMRVVQDTAMGAVAALPFAIGVGILKYRLYEIDRLISRTLSYAALTALLAGVFIGIVVLATDVLPFSSPVGVAASTLAAAALFNPLRLRVQRVVDRRFNRARYDAEAIVAAFSTRLRDAVDFETVRGELLHAVDRAVEPVHASVWIRPAASK